MKIKIDKGKCTGCSTCMAMCQEVFGFDTDGKSKVKKQPTESELSRVKEAIISCPGEAIIEF